MTDGNNNSTLTTTAATGDIMNILGAQTMNSRTGSIANNSTSNLVSFKSTSLIPPGSMTTLSQNGVQVVHGLGAANSMLNSQSAQNLILDKTSATSKPKTMIQQYSTQEIRKPLPKLPTPTGGTSAAQLGLLGAEDPFITENKYRRQLFLESQQMADSHSNFIGQYSTSLADIHDLRVSMRISQSHVQLQPVQVSNNRSGINGSNNGQAIKNNLSYPQEFNGNSHQQSRNLQLNSQQYQTQQLPPASQLHHPVPQNQSRNNKPQLSLDPQIAAMQQQQIQVQLGPPKIREAHKKFHQSYSPSHSQSNAESNQVEQQQNQQQLPQIETKTSLIQAPEHQLTAQGLPQTQLRVKKLSRGTSNESEVSLNDTDPHYPQQPSSGETMEYKYKKTPSNSGQAQQLQQPQLLGNQYQQQAFQLHKDLEEYVDILLTDNFNQQQQQQFMQSQDINLETQFSNNQNIYQEQQERRRAKKKVSGLKIQLNEVSHHSGEDLHSVFNYHNNYSNETQTQEQQYSQLHLYQSDKSQRNNQYQQNQDYVSRVSEINLQNQEDQSQKITMLQDQFQKITERNESRDSQASRNLSFNQQLQQRISQHSSIRNRTRQSSRSKNDMKHDSARYASSKGSRISQIRQSAKFQEDDVLKISQIMNLENNQRQYQLTTQGSRNFEEILANQRTDSQLDESPQLRSVNKDQHQLSQAMIEDVPAAPFETSSAQIEIPHSHIGDDRELNQSPGKSSHIQDQQDTMVVHESPKFSSVERQPEEAEAEEIKDFMQPIPFIVDQNQMKNSYYAAQAPIYDPKDSDNLMILLQTHKTFQRGIRTPQQQQIMSDNTRKLNFRRKRNDMVLRQMKFIQNQFPIQEEAFAIDQITSKENELKKDKFQINKMLLRMIPTRPAQPEWPRTEKSIVSKPLKVDANLINPQSYNQEHKEVPIYARNDSEWFYAKNSQSGRAIMHSKVKRSHSSGSASRRVISLQSDSDSFNIMDARARYLRKLVKAKLLEPSGDQIFKAAVLLTKKSHSVQKRIYNEISEMKEKSKILHVEDLFPKKIDFQMHENQHHYHSTRKEIFNYPIERQTDSRGNHQHIRYQNTNSLSFEEIELYTNNTTNRSKNHPRTEIKTRLSYKEQDQYPKRWSDSFQQKAIKTVSRLQTPTLFPTIKETVQEIREEYNPDQYEINQNTQERILSDYEIEQIRYNLEQRSKVKEYHMSQTTSKSKLDQQIQPQLKSMIFKNLDLSIFSGTHKIFIFSLFYNDYSQINDEMIKKLVIALTLSPSKSTHANLNSLQKSNDYKPSTFSNSKRRGTIFRPNIQKVLSRELNSPPVHNVFNFIITDATLIELLRLEQKYLYNKKVYDVLTDPAIFNLELYQKGEITKDKKLIENLPNPLIITIRRPKNQEEYDQQTFIIMDFMREQYLNFFDKYSRHLTINERPLSRFYNNHLTRQLAMLATKSFENERHILPKWQVQNNTELLNFQVAQLRRSYANWLSRVSMNEDIRKTLFMSKSDLLMMKIKTAPNDMLISPQLVTKTIEKVIELCLRPEDIYKLTLIYKQGKKAPERFEDATSLDTQPHGEDESMIYVEQHHDQKLNQEIEVVQALYLHNHPIFNPYNNELENGMKITDFKTQTFRMSTLFGYKPKMIKEGLYEVFEPAPDARFILSKIFKRAFLRVQTAKSGAPNRGGHLGAGGHVTKHSRGRSSFVSKMNLSATSHRQ